MNINYHISPSVVTEDFVAKAYEIALDGTISEVGSIDVPAPHTSPTNISFTGLDRVTHMIKLIGVTSSIEYHKYDIAPTVDTVTVFDFIRFKIGDGGPNTPAAGATAYVNSAMIGFTADDYVAIRSGYGPVFEGIHIDNEPTGGGFLLHDVADVFADKEEWVIMPKPSVITTPVNDSVVGKLWGPTPGNSNMYVNVSSTVSYTATHLRKLIRLAGVNANYKFTSGEVPPVGYIFRISNYGSYGSLTPAPKVTFENAACKYGNTTITEVSVMFGQVIECVWDGTLWNLSMSEPLSASIPTFYKGVYTVGDVPVTKTVTITIPTQPNTNYWAGITLINTAYYDNTLAAQVVESTKTTTSFQVILNEISVAIQNVKISWVVINF